MTSNSDEIVSMNYSFTSQENGKKGIEIKKKCGLNSCNYLKDELYLLQLLNYDLHIFTSYDILIDCLYCGFIFSDETFSTKKRFLRS